MKIFKKIKDLDERIIVFLLWIFALSIRIFQSIMIHVVTKDSVKIIDRAMIFENLGNISLFDFAMDVHPLFPLLLSLLAKTGIGYEIAGKALSVFFGSITLFPIFFLAKRVYDQKTAILASFLFALHPYLFINSAELLRDSTCIFFMVASVFLCWEGFEKGRYRYLVFAGITSVLAYLTKAEGLFIIIIIFSFIWVRDFKISRYNFKERILHSLSFLLLPLIIGIPFIVVVSLKTGSFNISIGRPLKIVLDRGKNIIQDHKHSLKVLDKTTGFSTLDRFFDFILFFVRSIFEPFIVLFMMNVTRLWTWEKLSRAEKYLLFVILVHLGLVFLYYNSIHRLTDRWFLFSIALLIIPMGYGMKILIDLCKKLNDKIKHHMIIRPGDALIFLLLFGLIFGNIWKGLRNTRYHWSSFKITGEYILEHYGPNKTFLCDDRRLAYYSNGIQAELVELDLNELKAKFKGNCPYDFIALCSRYNFSFMEEYPEIFSSEEYDIMKIPFPPDVNNIYLFKCSDFDKLE